MSNGANLSVSLSMVFGLSNLWFPRFVVCGLYISLLIFTWSVAKGVVGAD